MNDFQNVLKLLVEVGEGEVEGAEGEKAPAGGFEAMQKTDPGQILGGHIEQHQALAKTFNDTVTRAFQQTEKTLSGLRTFQYMKGKAALPSTAPLSQKGPLSSIPIRQLPAGLSTEPGSALASLQAMYGPGAKKEHRITEVGEVSPEATKGIGDDYAVAKDAITQLLTTFRTAYNTYKDGTDRLMMQLQSKLPDISAGHGYGMFAHAQLGRYEKQIHEMEKNFERQRESYQEEIDRYQRLNEDLKTQLEEAQSTLADARTKWQQDLEKMGAEGQARVAEKVADIERKTQELQQIQQTLAQREAQIGSKQREVEGLSAQVEQRGRDIQAASERNQLQAGHLKEYGKAVAMFQKEWEKLRQQTEGFRDEADALRTHLMKLGAYRFAEPGEAPEATGEAVRPYGVGPYGRFNLREYLRRATSNSRYHEGNW